MKSASSLLSVAFFIASMLVGACHPSQVAYTPQAVEDPTLNSAEYAESMSVALLDWEDASPNCGGVWVAEDKILTAFHCVADNGRPANAAGGLLEALGIHIPWDPSGQGEGFQVKGDETQYKSKIVSFDRSHDLALLRVVGASPTHGVAKVRHRAVRDGEELDVVGSTLGLPFSYSRCFVGASVREDWKVQVSGPIYFGNSGGGAFDLSGNLVGIALSMKGRSDGTVVPDLSFFAGPSALASFLGA